MVAAMAGTAQHRDASAGPRRLPLVLLLVAVLAGCATGPRPAASSALAVPDRDGPGANPPPGLVDVPDAEPKLEPIRVGGPNKPYEALGQTYVPITQDKPFTERGLASWYGRKFHGRPTASGEAYDMYAMTAAHPTLPIPSFARVRNPANGRQVVVRINDRGPFHSTRIVDLSYTAALKLGVLRGVASVELERITFDDIRTGAWRRGAPAGPGPVPAELRTATAAEPLLAAPPATPSDAALVPAAPSDAAPLLQEAPRSSSAAAPGFWVQLGAFRQRDGADGFQRRVASEADWLGPLLTVFRDAALFRLQAGPYASRDEARGVAERVRAALQLVPVIVERR
jgi:rare lipoprotein A